MQHIQHRHQLPTRRRLRTDRQRVIQNPGHRDSTRREPRPTVITEQLAWTLGARRWWPPSGTSVEAIDRLDPFG